MDADGGTSRYPTNKAGAAYGIGYCDSQCQPETKWIDGKANSDNWHNDEGFGTHRKLIASQFLVYL